MFEFLIHSDFQYSPAGYSKECGTGSSQLPIRAIGTIAQRTIRLIRAPDQTLRKSSGQSSNTRSSPQVCTTADPEIPLQCRITAKPVINHQWTQNCNKIPLASQISKNKAGQIFKSSRPRETPLQTQNCLRNKRSCHIWKFRKFIVQPIILIFRATTHRVRHISVSSVVFCGKISGRFILKCKLPLEFFLAMFCEKAHDVAGAVNYRGDTRISAAETAAACPVPAAAKSCILSSFIYVFKRYFSS